MRSRFDEQLALLNKEMIEMGALCEEVIALASKALTEADPELAQRVAPLDAEIDLRTRLAVLIHGDVASGRIR